MKDTDIIEYLDTQSTIMALWWYIENQGSCSSEIFFYLRKRVREWEVEQE